MNKNRLKKLQNQITENDSDIESAARGTSPAHLPPTLTGAASTRPPAKANQSKDFEICDILRRLEELENEHQTKTK